MPGSSLFPADPILTILGLQTSAEYRKQGSRNSLAGQSYTTACTITQALGISRIFSKKVPSH